MHGIRSYILLVFGFSLLVFAFYSLYYAFKGSDLRGKLNGIMGFMCLGVVAIAVFFLAVSGIFRKCW